MREKKFSLAQSYGVSSARVYSVHAITAVEVTHMTSRYAESKEGYAQMVKTLGEVTIVRIVNDWNQKRADRAAYNAERNADPEVKMERKAYQRKRNAKIRR